MVRVLLGLLKPKTRIGICYFSAKQAGLRRIKKNEDILFFRKAKGDHRRRHYFTCHTAGKVYITICYGVTGTPIICHSVLSLVTASVI